MGSPVQQPTAATQLVEFNKKNVKARRIILDAIKDHLFPHATGKKFAYEMWESLVSSHTTPNFQ